MQQVQVINVIIITLYPSIAMIMYTLSAPGIVDSYELLLVPGSHHIAKFSVFGLYFVSSKFCSWSYVFCLLMFSSLPMFLVISVSVSVLVGKYLCTVNTCTCIQPQLLFLTCCPCPNLFDTFCRCQLQNEHMLKKKKNSVSIFDVCLFSGKYVLICKSSHSVFTQRPNFFGEVVVEGSAPGHHFVLVFVDHETWDPETFLQHVST